MVNGKLCLRADPSTLRQRASWGPHPRTLDTNQVTAARGALDAGQPVDQVAAAFGVSSATLYRNLAEPEPAEQ